MPKPIEQGYINENPETEFGQKQMLLAVFLYQIAYGAHRELTLEDEELRTNYMLDAAEVLLSQPHLLSLEERERLAPQYPEVSL